MAAHGKSSGHDVPNPQTGSGATLLRYPVCAAFATLIVALVAAIGLARLINDQLQHAAGGRFEWRAAHTTADLRRELIACEEVLRGASGLIAAASPLPPDAWRQYVTRLSLDDKLSTVLALGYADAGTDGAARLAADTARPARPLAPLTLMYPSRPDAPPADYDVGRDPLRRAALLRAADTGQAALNALAAPFSVRPEGARVRFELYLPVYRSTSVPATREGRRAAVAGFIVAQIDAGRLLANLAVHERFLDMQVFAGMQGRLLYASNAAGDETASDPPLFRRTETLRFGGEPLTLVYTTGDRYLGAGDDLSSNAVLALGVLVSVLLAAVVFLLVRARTS
jgi:CHASE1-domain containing sensor protein